MNYCLLIVCAVAVLCSGCKTEQQFAPGVLATVNEQPITLRQVEALHDVDGSSLVMAQSPSLELLRTQYGHTLATLMAGALITQELQHIGQSVTEGDVQLAEETVRADYPADEFEKHLLEEYIDLDAWRELLRQRLEVQRFQDRVLRPLVVLSPDEVSEYYKAHLKEFYRPQRMPLTVYTGVDRVQMENVRAGLLEGHKPVSDVSLTIDELNLPLDRLFPAWKKDITATPFGKPTPVREMDGFFQFFVASEPLAARPLTVVEAYTVIEQQLVENKLEPLFQEWMTKALENARIRLSPHIKPFMAPEK